MRLWTIHPCYLDAKGLVALWREGLLAQKVLQGKTKGYRHHPQLIRFQSRRQPEAIIAVYLKEVLREAERRGYRFDATKIPRIRSRTAIPETDGQLLYEWKHLLKKLNKRDRARYEELKTIVKPRCHPLFKIICGSVRDWEKKK